MTDQLSFVPPSEIARALSASNDPEKRTQLFATAARLNALYMIARAGSGHIGSSFSSIDIVSWLYLNELQTGDGKYEGDVFFSSKGHDAPGFYAVLIGLGLLPADKLDGLRRIDGLPGHPDVATPHVATNTGSLGMGISKAKGMIEADRLAGRKRRYVVMTGDGELQEGQIWESLQGAVNRKLQGLTIVVDHNKIQSDHWVRDTSDLGDLEAKFKAFGWAVFRCDGHDFGVLRKAFADAASAGRPAAIIADTMKGKGVSLMEPGNLGPRDLYKFHSGAPSPENYAAAVSELSARLDSIALAAGMPPLHRTSVPCAPAAAPSNPHRIIPDYAEALLRAGCGNPKIVAMDADLVLDCGVIPFRDALPDRYFECGIAEQDMVSMASGLSLGGFLPIVHSFACFMTPRANEQIYNNATELTKVIYVGSLAGLLPAGPGHSHQSVRDIALMASFPDIVAIEPASGPQAAEALQWMIEKAKGPCYLRLVSVPVALTYEPSKAGALVEGQGIAMTDGSDAVLFAYGPVMLTEAVAAASLLNSESGVQVKVVNMPWLNRFDPAWLRASVGGARHVFTLDNHFMSGGQGERIAAAIAGLGLKAAPAVTAFAPRAIPACGTNDEVLCFHRLDRRSLADDIKRALGKV